MEYTFSLSAMHHNKFTYMIKDFIHEVGPFLRDLEQTLTDSNSFMVSLPGCLSKLEDR